MKSLHLFFFLLALVLVFLLVSCSKIPRVAEVDMRVLTQPVLATEKLPTWKGFNLLNMFYKGSNDSAFSEKDFQTISEWGFNFVRIPIDYRILIVGNNWDNYNKNAIGRLDKAIEYGMKYNIHICINLHRAPGYTVASPKEATDLWTQEKPQEAFARMWGYFAERYRNISSENLSFNLINEPPNMDEAIHAMVMKKAVDAIRVKDPNRLIIADGREYGSRPSNMIRELGLAQATRGYYPNNISHYQADWMEGSYDYPRPAWPTIQAPRYLYGLGKHDVPRSIYHITHDFNEAYYLDVNVGVVSHEARLIVKADGKTVYEKLFESSAGKGEWTTVVYRKEWNIYQNIYNKDYRIEIPSGTRLVTLEVTDGDWMTINDMIFTPVSKNGNGKTFSFTPNNLDWAREIPPVVIDANGLPEGSESSKEWLWDTAFKQWEDYIDSGGVMVGEWGAHNRTPHDVVLRWMEDNLMNFKKHGLGWALWNFDGSFGVVNSGRRDVQYENYKGYKLDRKMLELLQKYLD
jgi:aryl-phospho-beta-D-glucosidase BglC (GH1 family)